MRQHKTKCHFTRDPSQLLTVRQKKLFMVYVLLYVGGPFIFVPLWAHHEGNWQLLIGILASLFGVFLGARAAGQGAGATSGGFLPFVLAGTWDFEGLHGRDTFYIICATGSWAIYLMADAAQRHWAEGNLLASAELYDAAVAGESVIVVESNA